MRRYLHWLLPVSVALMTGCSSSGEVIRYPGPQAEVENSAAADDAALRERQMAEQNARAEAERLAREEAARQAEQARRAELARQEAEEAARREEQARQEQARREQAAREARERAARELAEQQTRAARLRERIAATEASAQNIDEANEALRQAVIAAESLVQALADEQNKYSSTDPQSGATLVPLDTQSVEALQRELDRLKSQAEVLMGQVAR